VKILIRYHLYNLSFGRKIITFLKGLQFKLDIHKLKKLLKTRQFSK